MAFPAEDGAAALLLSWCPSARSFTTGTASLAEVKQVLNHLEPGDVHSEAGKPCVRGSVRLRPQFLEKWLG